MSTVEQTLRDMGLNRAKARSDRELARSCRKSCRGRFGSMTTNQWNLRIIGTYGQERRAYKAQEADESYTSYGFFERNEVR